MAFLPGYCSVEFADTVNSSTEWVALSEEEKEYALTMGRLYIDKIYSCADSSSWDTTDYTTIPDEVQQSNAILGDQYAQGILIPDTSGPSGPITKKRVKAGSVESETMYQGYFSTSSKHTDPKPEITLLLSPYCTYGTSADLIRV